MAESTPGMSAVAADITSALSPSDVTRVVWLQSLVRRNRARRRYLKMVQRARVAKELLTTEQTYVGGLELMIRLYIKPLNESAKSKEPIISRAKIQAIFSVVEVMTSLNAVLLQDLEKRVAAWNNDSLLGDIFLTMGDYLKVATQYVNNYDVAIKTVSTELKANPAFKAFYEKTQANPESKKNDLKSFLILPVQRIPRYEMLLKELIKKTPPDHADFGPLKQAYDKIKGISGIIDNRKDDNVKQQEVVRIQSLCEPKVHNLIQPTRRLVLQLQLRRHEHTSTFRFGLLRNSSADEKPLVSLFLFNDVLLICDTVRNSNSAAGAAAAAPASTTHQYVPLEPLLPLQAVTCQVGKGTLTLQWIDVAEGLEEFVSPKQKRHKEKGAPPGHQIVLSTPDKDDELVADFVKKLGKLREDLRAKLGLPEGSSGEVKRKPSKEEDDPKKKKSVSKIVTGTSEHHPPVPRSNTNPDLKKESGTYNAEGKRDMISMLEAMLEASKAKLAEASSEVVDDVKALRDLLEPKVRELEATLEQHRRELAVMTGTSSPPSADSTSPPVVSPTASGSVPLASVAARSRASGSWTPPVTTSPDSTLRPKFKTSTGVEAVLGDCAFCHTNITPKEAVDAVEMNGAMLHSRCVSSFRKSRRSGTGADRKVSVDGSAPIIPRSDNAPPPIPPFPPSLAPPSSQPPTVVLPGGAPPTLVTPAGAPPSLVTPVPAPRFSRGDTGSGATLAIPSSGAGSGSKSAGPSPRDGRDK